MITGYTKRFRQAVSAVIESGKVKDQKSFAKVVKQDPSNFNRFMRSQNVTLPMLEIVCRKFNLSADWIILGEGEMWRK